MRIEKILVVDDEELMRHFLAEALKRKNYSVDLATNGKTAFSLLRKNAYDLVITDMKMPNHTGIDVLRKTKELQGNIPVIVMTAYGTIENAVEAMRLGAFNYLLKPFTPDAIEILIEKANEHVGLIEENRYLRDEIKEQHIPNQVIVESPVMKKILTDSAKIAQSQASVLIHGESGTGKEVIASAIHALSMRADKPYIRVNCAAIPDTLIESEFFGHEKGSFTGANTKKPGRFELADQGTLLLDEVTEIPLILQPKLLRVIQEREFERVGGTKPLSVDVRLISTSNRDLKEAISQKIFREDLYYRLNVIPIYLPPLRDRREDILPLARYFISQFCQKNGKNKKKFTEKAQKKLLDYSWPGNIRELSNLMERIVVLDYSSKIEPDHFTLS
ncbi:MAG: Regulatory protein AtoC [Chlamydiales bacterium]|nr:Regulatory protein AtoC [Chlamydiales bacterium]